MLRREGHASWVELGDARVIDKQVSQFRAALQDRTSRNSKEVGRALYEQVMQPIRTLLGDSGHILLSPDGGLSLIPFSALVDEQNHYLIEKYLITYLTSGRDLLRSLSPGQTLNRPLVIANPLFEGVGNDDPGPQDSSALMERAIDFTKIKYSPLPGSALEAKEIAAVLTDAEVLTGAEATERFVKRAIRPRILHIATHGFFLEDQKSTKPGERGLVRERSDLSLENPPVAIGPHSGGGGET
ncbi:MAG TPA: CHAT domain-containing protein [Pyrinomonadaceae bacterium]|nr:CHAT domain-containing protein [Pyrinomonadaceae bacterium]